MKYTQQFAPESLLHRRDVLLAGGAIALPIALAPIALTSGCKDATSSTKQKQPSGSKNPTTKAKGDAMNIHYLEFVTTDVESVCKQYTESQGITFSEPNPVLGGARTAMLADGCTFAVRSPLRETELPVVRPYFLVEDIEAAVAKAVETGGQLALPPMELPGYGICAIVINGGIDCGFWQI